MSTQRFTVVVEIDAENNTAQAFGEFNKGLKESGKQSSLLDGVMQGVGQRLTDMAAQLPQIAAQTFQMGVQSQSATLRFERFAGSAERAEELLTAFQVATDGTVDRMGAMTSAARLLQMGLVSNSDEMATVAQIATRLGDQTQGATDRISDFSLLLANQSIPRLDNFGISSGKVRARIKELQAATKDLSREEAFKIAVMEEGRKSLDILGDSSELASVKIDKLKAATKDAQAGLGEMLVSLVDGIGGVDELAARIRGIPVALDQAILMLQAFGQASQDNFLRPRQAMEDFAENLRAVVREREAANIVFEEAAFVERVLTDQTADLNMESERARVAIAKIAASGEDSAASFSAYQAALESSRKAEEDLAIASLEANRVLAEQQRIADEAAVKQTELASALFKATDAEIATTAIRELGNLLDEDKITTEEYTTAVTETQLAFGLADEASIRLAGGLLALTEKFGEGQIKAEVFDDALLSLITATNNQRAAVEELGVSIDQLPESKTIDIEVRVRQIGDAPAAALPSSGGFAEFQSGGVSGGGMALVGERGPELVSLPRGSQVHNNNTTNQFTMNITGQTSPNVIGDFETMRSLVA
jgi:hypothetical protein